MTDDSSADLQTLDATTDHLDSVHRGGGDAGVRARPRLPPPGPDQLQPAAGEAHTRK